ncbi:PDDEXK nuclease domain-containing protein [Prevotella sp.]|uniref:PDDEXK nuclease domain-containing protein n=1 Tax=Prevotella sp. TaxID=59823 RepID=UPI002A8224C3|nr:PDDEXK nuclease domain-containing protein [Prevotella sp.]MDY4644597.1 PDDEXK nuclease domain-containing protein [Prevotella sp.]
MNYTIMANESTTYLHDGMELPVEDWSQNTHSFDELTKIIRDTHDAAQTTAVKAINRMQTMRNWLYGYYIIEFEQHGKDRAEYGTQLLKRLEERVNRKGLTETLFKNSRKFYRLYPQMVENIIGVISPTVSDKLLESKDASGLCDTQMTENEHVEKSPTVSDGFRTTGQMIISRLSFSHIVEIMTVDDPLARYFYEQECIKCTWSVRELRRQISTNLYVRTGISSNPEKMLSLPSLQGHDNNELQIRQPFTFEFLGLKANEVVDEKDIENALIDHLQDFLLELGKGFCFESRQKRIIIDDEYYYPDLVFYNRILHCGVIIELKDEEFSHQNLGQLNAYVSHYKEHEMQPGDNPPIGILLCTRKGKKMVEYALAGMDNQLFVSTYMLQLPDKKTLEDFLLKQLEK